MFSVEQLNSGTYVLIKKKQRLNQCKHTSFHDNSTIIMTSCQTYSAILNSLQVHILNSLITGWSGWYVIGIHFYQKLLQHFFTGFTYQHLPTSPNSFVDSKYELAEIPSTIRINLVTHCRKEELYVRKGEFEAIGCLRIGGTFEELPYPTQHRYHLFVCLKIYEQLQRQFPNLLFPLFLKTKSKNP